MNRLLALICLVVLTTSSQADVFTYDIQQAGYDFNQYDEKGETDFEGFRKAFREFPWLDQVGLGTGKSEPTLSAKNSTERTALWVSIAGDRKDNIWLVGYIYPVPKTGPTMVGPRREIRWLEVYFVEDRSSVENYFSTYFAGESDTLLESLRKEVLFAEMEAQK